MTARPLAPRPWTNPLTRVTPAHSIEEIDAALRQANAEGFIHYTLDAIEQKTERLAALRTKLATVRGAE